MRKILWLLIFSTLFLLFGSCNKVEISDETSGETTERVQLDESTGETTEDVQPDEPIGETTEDVQPDEPIGETTEHVQPDEPADEIPEHVHSFGEWTVKTAPSCTEQGYEERTCICGAFENRSIDPVGHSFGDWEIIVPANCVEAGTRQRVCLNCSHTESAPTESVHPLGEAEPFIEATCYQRGYTIYNCTVCSYYEVQEIIQTHEFISEVELYPATCVQSGGVERYCSKCEKTLRDYTAPLGHDEYDWTRVESKSNSVVLVEEKGCRRCDEANEERKNFVKNTLEADETVLELMNPYSPLNPNFNYTQAIYKAAGSCYSKNGYYQAYLSFDDSLAVIVYMDANGNKIVCSAVRTDLGWADDLAYNSKTNQLLVLNEKNIVIFDGDTLAYVRTVTMPRSGSAIAYVESTDQYAIIVDHKVEYYNAQFGYVCCHRVFIGNGPYQMCADENYVYVMFVADDGINRYVDVYLHNGISLGQVDIKKSSDTEPTGISIVDGYLYISIPDRIYPQISACIWLKKLG